MSWGSQIIWHNQKTFSNPILQWIIYIYFIYLLIYLYMYTCVCVCIYIYTYTYIYIYIIKIFFGEEESQK